MKTWVRWQFIVVQHTYYMSLRYKIDHNKSKTITTLCIRQSQHAIQSIHTSKTISSRECRVESISGIVPFDPLQIIFSCTIILSPILSVFQQSLSLTKNSCVNNMPSTTFFNQLSREMYMKRTTNTSKIITFEKLIIKNEDVLECIIFRIRIFEIITSIF